MRGALSLIEQSQDQTVLRVVLDVGGVRGVIPRPERSPLASRLALAACQIDDHLVLRQRGSNIEYVDQQPLGVPIDGLGPRRAGAHTAHLGPGPTNRSCTVVPRCRTP